MHPDYLKHLDPESNLMLRAQISADLANCQSPLPIDSTNKAIIKWRNRFFITVVAFFSIISAQAAWYYSYPNYVGIPIYPAEADTNTSDLEAHFEKKFLQMARVLKFLVDEVKKHDELLVSNTKASTNRAEYNLSSSKIDNGVVDKAFGYIRGVVTAQKANIRPLPNLSSAPIMTLEKGTELLVDLTQDNWNRVVTPTGQKAWMSSKVMELEGAN